MATLETRFRAAIIGNAGVAALIVDRMFDRQLPQNPIFPCIRFQRISTIPLYSQENDSDQASVGWTRFQVDAIADGPDGGNVATAIALAVSKALQTFNLWSLPASPVVVNAAPNTVLNRRTGIEPSTKQPLFKEIVDVRCWYSEQ